MPKIFKTTIDNIKDRIKIANGEKKADLVLKNAKYVNLFTEKIEEGDIAICRSHIVGIGEYNGINEIDCTGKIISPSLIDAHIHLESVMISPRSFRDLVVPHGTCAVIADPHEIANVAGIDGINYILKMTDDLDLYVGIMLPSCVPSTPLDESGAILNNIDIKPLYDNERVLGLAEMMNAYGVVHCDEECIKKCVDAINSGKLIDGHAPKLTGKSINAYMTAGVSTDHECSNFEEAKEKLEKGQWIEIREGTACKDLNSLMKLFENPYYLRSMLATDDSHPDTIIDIGHIDKIVRAAISKGADPIKAIRMGSLNAADHYGLTHMGAIAVGYLANMIILDDLDTFKINSCYINGKKVSEGNTAIQKSTEIYNTLDKTEFKKVYYSFNMDDVKANDFKINISGTKIRAIELIEGGVLTKECEISLEKNNDNEVIIPNNIVKIAVIERHKNTNHIGIGFIKGYGLREGAIASSIGHDSHNIIVIGVSDVDIALAVNTVKQNNGGIVIVSDDVVLGYLKLEIAGLMTENDENYVIKTLERLKTIAYYNLGVNRAIDPFMTLAFMQLPVIPELKIIPKGLVRVSTQEIVPAIYS